MRHFVYRRLASSKKKSASPSGDGCIATAVDSSDDDNNDNKPSIDHDRRIATIIFFDLIALSLSVAMAVGNAVHAPAVCSA